LGEKNINKTTIDSWAPLSWWVGDWFFASVGGRWPLDRITRTPAPKAGKAGGDPSP